MIVGRDAKLDDYGIARASLESLSENTSDVALATLCLLFGLLKSFAKRLTL